MQHEHIAGTVVGHAGEAPDGRPGRVEDPPRDAVPRPELRGLGRGWLGAASQACIDQEHPPERIVVDEIVSGARGRVAPGVERGAAPLRWGSAGVARAVAEEGSRHGDQSCSGGEPHARGGYKALLARPREAATSRRGAAASAGRACGPRSTLGVAVWHCASPDDVERTATPLGAGGDRGGGGGAGDGDLADVDRRAGARAPARPRGARCGAVSAAGPGGVAGRGDLRREGRGAVGRARRARGGVGGRGAVPGGAGGGATLRVALGLLSAGAPGRDWAARCVALGDACGRGGAAPGAGNARRADAGGETARLVQPALRREARGAPDPGRLADGDVAGAVRVCVDFQALARDASWGTGLAGRLPALAVEEVAFRPCAAALDAAPVEVKRGAAVALSRVEEGTPSLAVVMREYAWGRGHRPSRHTSVGWSTCRPRSRPGRGERARGAERLAVRARSRRRVAPDRRAAGSGRGGVGSADARPGGSAGCDRGGRAALGEPASELRASAAWTGGALGRASAGAAPAAAWESRRTSSGRSGVGGRRPPSWWRRWGAATPWRWSRTGTWRRWWTRRSRAEELAVSVRADVPPASR